MTKDAMIAKVSRISCHEVKWGRGGLVTSVTVSFGDEEDNEDRHAPVFELTVEYAGHPRHKVGDKYVTLPVAILDALEIAR
jgi:hypothetical protein